MHFNTAISNAKRIKTYPLLGVAVVLSVKCGNRGGSFFMTPEIDESGLAALLVEVDAHLLDLPKSAEHLLQIGLVEGGGEVLDVDVGEGFVGISQAGLPRLEGFDNHALPADLHAVHAGNGFSCGLGVLVVHEAVAEGVSVVVRAHFAGEDGAEEGERLEQRLRINLGIQILDEDVRLITLPQARITVREHNPARPAAHVLKIQGAQGGLGILSFRIVDVRISQRAAGGVTADANRLYLITPKLR